MFSLFYSFSSNEIVKLLLDYKADINQVDIEGNNLIYQYIKSQKDEIPSLNLLNGIDINHQNSKGNTLMHEAIINGKINILKQLMTLNPDISKYNYDGNNVLDVRSGNFTSVPKLPDFI